MFIFYMAPLVPFLIIGMVLALGALLGPGQPERPARDLDAESIDPDLYEDAEIRQ